MLTVTTPDPETSERLMSQGGVTAGVPSGVTTGVVSGVPCTTDADYHAACSKEHSFL